MAKTQAALSHSSFLVISWYVRVTLALLTKLTFQIIGNVRTLASDNLITDSAASATAFGCGVKTYNAGKSDG